MGADPGVGPASAGLPAWHQALAYALTGQTYPELGYQTRPDLALLVDFLRGRLPADRAELSRPRPLPPALAAGIGPAQLGAAVADLRAQLLPPAGTAAPVTADRPPSADEQRLLREVPPHHGS